MALRNYTNTAPLLQISGDIAPAATVITVASTSGYPTVPFTIALERGTVNAEVVLCTGKTGTTFTVTRGWDGTTAVTHLSGAALEHTSAAADYTDANAHVYDTARDDHTQYLRKATWTAKGAIVAASGAATPVALAVGSNDTTLLADSAQASGVKWGQVPTAGIADGAVTYAKLSSANQLDLVRKLTTGTLPAGTTGQLVATTDNNRLVGYLAGAWMPIAHGVGRIYVSSGTPSGGADGDVWLRYS